jgi:Trypsin-like peptidase domain
MDHPARARVAEIVVSRAGKEDTRGSGYVVSPGWVLTACHVVQDVTSIGVWLGAPPELVSEEGVGVDIGRVLTVPAADLALLPLGELAGDPLCEPALFGRLDRDPGPPVPVAAAGCPRFKLRPAPDRPGVLLRELDYAIGSIAALSDAKTGRFAFAVDVAPGPDSEPDKHSPWEGMSGAAVWASGRLIGVVGQHHPREGLATLTVCPVEQLFGSASEDQLEAWRTALPQLPTVEDLWLATPPTLKKIEVVRARRAVEALAPRVLIGRGAELAALEAFTSSDLRWRWIQGDAFAGKTALMAWFALHPPERVDITACFLRRASGEDTAEYALDVLTRQLALLADRRGYLPPPSVSERNNDFADLLEEATRACAERDRRLLVLIDGLDEYDPTSASLDLADWLPGDRMLPDQAMLLAASRAGADVRLPPAHPLCRFVQHITASEAATEIQHAAHAELDRAARAPGGFLLPLLCCLAVSGSGLTVSDMAALLKRRGRDADISEIEAQLSSSLGRSLIRLPNLEGTGTPVYAFAHDTLLTEARSRFASDLRTYEDLLDAWASDYADRGWPSDTPQYLLAPYTRELARRARDLATPDASRGKAMSGALDRLSALARSPSRQAFLLRATGTDYAALTEIKTVLSLSAELEVPDLTALVELAIYRHAISIRNRSIPAQLPIVWVRLARFDHAEALASTIADPDAQAHALIGLCIAIGEAGDLDRAEALVRVLTGPDAQAEALTGLVSVAAQAGDLDRAEALARVLTGPDAQAEALTGLVSVAAQAGDSDRARRLATDVEALARTVTDPGTQALVLARSAIATAQAGDFDRAYRLAVDAEALARTVADSYAKVQTLTGLASFAVKAGDFNRARRLVDEASTLAIDIRYHYHNDDYDHAVSRLAIVAAQAGDMDRADNLARTSGEDSARAQALTALVSIAAQGGDSESVDDLIFWAEANIRNITDPDAQAQTLTGLVTVTAQAVDLDRAEALARSTTTPYVQVQTLGGLVTVAARAGDSDRARRLATDAEALARTITDRYAQAQALTALAAAIAQAGDSDRAHRLATDAEALARTITDPDVQEQMLAGLVTAVAQAGDLNRAEALARTITDPGAQEQALAGLVTAVAQAGDLDRAEALARTITDPDAQAQALGRVGALAAETGDFDRAYRLAADAESIARTLTEWYAQARILGGLVTIAAQAGDPTRAHRLAAEAKALVDSPTVDSDAREQAKVDVAIAIAQAGDLDRAEAIARTLSDALAPWYYLSGRNRAPALAPLVAAMARAGDLDRAEALARDIHAQLDKAKALIELAIVAAQAGDLDRAEALVHVTTDHVGHKQALAGLVTAMSWADDSISSTDGEAQALTGLVTAMARAGDSDRAHRLASDAEALARTITDPDAQEQALAGLVTTVAQAGDLNRAEALARTITSPDRQAQAFTGLVIAIAQAGDLNRAEAIARTITTPDRQAQALTGLATTIAEAGNLERALHLLAVALSIGAPEIGWWIGTVTRLFPSAVRAAGSVFMSAYQTGTLASTA